jgi:hypothetical protein
MMKLVMCLKRTSTTVILENSRIDYWNPYANNTDTATPKRTRPYSAEATNTDTAWSTRTAAYAAASDRPKASAHLLDWRRTHRTERVKN